MAGEPEDFILAYFRPLDGKMDRLLDAFGDIKHRLSAVELGLVGVRRELATFAETDARLGVNIDRMADRLDRIERRLDIVDA